MLVAKISSFGTRSQGKVRAYRSQISKNDNNSVSKSFNKNKKTPLLVFKPSHLTFDYSVFSELITDIPKTNP